jgi:aspartate oxidase
MLSHPVRSAYRLHRVSLIDKAKQHPNITLLEHHNAIDLITADKLGLKQQRVLGAYVLDTHSKQVRCNSDSPFLFRRSENCMPC